MQSLFAEVAPDLSGESERQEEISVPILLVDDEKSQLEAMGTELRKACTNVLTAETDAEGIRQFHTFNRPAILLLDLNFDHRSRMDGIALCKYLQSVARYFTYPIGVTGEKDPAKELAARRAGMNSFYGKTTPVAFLWERLQTARRIIERIELGESDAVTGVLPRGIFEFVARQELRRTAVYGDPMACILLDADHFKLVNDNAVLQHLTGDEALRRLGACIKEHLRGQDTAGRWGGEELAVLLPKMELAGAVHVAERLRAAVEALRVPDGPNRHIGITVSAGVAVVEGSGYDAPGDVLTNLVGAADSELRKAKNAGRNCVWPVVTSGG